MSGGIRHAERLGAREARRQRVATPGPLGAAGNLSSGARRRAAPLSVPSGAAPTAPRKACGPRSSTHEGRDNGFRQTATPIDLWLSRPVIWASFPGFDLPRYLSPLVIPVGVPLPEPQNTQMDRIAMH